MKLRKMASVILSMALVATTLTGCSSSSQGEKSSGKTTIEYMNFSGTGANEELLKNMESLFEEQNPDIDINIQTVGFEDYFQQLATKIAGGSAPDVFELNIENFSAYAKKGAIKEMDSVLQEIGFDESTVRKEALDAFKIDGKQFGIPQKFSNVVMVYNKDLFDQAGVKYPTDEWTWEDELNAAKKIKALGNGVWGTLRPVQTFEFFKTVKQNGGSMMSEDGKSFTINKPENVEAITKLTDLYLKEKVSPMEKDLGGMQDIDLFKAGKLGMIVTGIWNLPDFEENANFNWDIAVEPAIKQKATHFFSDAVVISSETKNEDAAAKWVTFLAANEEGAKMRLEAGGDLPVINNEEITNSYLQQTPPENKQAVLDSLEYLVLPPSIEDFVKVQDDLNRYLEEIMYEKLSVQDALDKAQDEISQKYKLD